MYELVPRVKNKKHRFRLKRKPRGSRQDRIFASGVFTVGGLFLVLVSVMAEAYLFPVSYVPKESGIKAEAKKENGAIAGVADFLKSKPKLDKEEYDRRLLALANRPKRATSTESQTASSSATSTVSAPKEEFLWPADDVYPNVGAILPFHRIVAFYGNFYSKKMGILGEYSEDEVLRRMRSQIREWEKADPDTPVMPAIDYIAVTAQGTAGEDGNYNLRMPDEHVERAITMAEKVNGIVILEVQAGHADLLEEIKLLEKYLKKPEVHLAIDPEFYMKRGNVPGTYIGTVDAADVNAASDYLAELVRKHNLPPKVLVIHRFTQQMVQDAQNIQPLPEVQIVIDMDGWGPQAKKEGTYKRVIYPEPVQFTGFKVFYKNDLKAPSTGIMTPKDILELRPKPIFIQYQ